MPKHRSRRHSVAYAILSIIVFAIALPLLMSSRDTGLGFRPAAVMAAARDSFSVSSPIPLIPSAGLTLDSGSISIAPSQAASARSAEALLTLLTGGSARLILEGGTFTFGDPGRVQNAGALRSPLDAVAPLLVSLTESRFELLSIHHGKVAIEQTDGAPLLLTDLNAEVSLRRKGSVAAKGTFEFRNETLSFDILIALGDRKATTRLPIKFTLKGALIDVAMDGRLTVGTGLMISSQNAALAISDLRRTAHWLGAAWPDGAGLKRFRAEGHLDSANREVSFQSATFELDGNTATGTLLANLNAPVPSFDATLALQSLDISTYLAAPGDGIRPAVPTKSDTAAVRAEFAFPMLAHVDLDLRVSADKVIAGPVTLGRGAASVTVKSGRLLADIAEIEIDADARGQGQISIDRIGPEAKITMKGKLRQLESSGISQMLFGQQLLRGRGDVVVDLAGSGDTTSRLLATLEGKVLANMVSSGQIGIELSELINQASSKTPTVGWGDAASGRTSFDNLVARFQVTSGLWSTELLRAKAGSVLYSASGMINPPTSGIDLILTRSSVVATPGGNHDPGVSVTIKGAWRNPLLQTSVPMVKGGDAIAPTLEPPAGPAVKSPGRG